MKNNKSRWLTRYLPFLDWLVHYRRDDLVGDLLGGVIVAIMLVPQGMAYAMLAGLPPQVGLYASILPLILYGFLGTSRTLAVGPVAMVSLMVAAGIANLEPAGPDEYLMMALVLALMVGIIQLAMGLVRLGFVVNFLSHPVLTGFTSAAALVIGLSQLKHLLGFSIPRSHYIHETLIYAFQNISQTNIITLVIGLISIALLIYFKDFLGNHLQKMNVPSGIIMPITKSGPLVVVLMGTMLVWIFGWNESSGVKIVGDVPAGLPPLTKPTFNLDLWKALFPTALAISFVGFMESISVAKALASKRRQKVDANQELIGLGTANIASAFTGGYPVTGGFSRSVVNFAAGTNTPLASMITAVLVGFTVIFLTPLFYFLPKAVLAAIIMVAVFVLIDIKTAIHVWQYNKADAISLLVTFFAVLTVGIEMGILMGVGVAIALYLWRTSRPHVAVVGRFGQTQYYRNVDRHKQQTKTYPNTEIVRIDENLYFANTEYLEGYLLELVANKPDLKNLILVFTAVNFVDASALETLEKLLQRLRDAKVNVYFAGIKGPVMDRLERVSFRQHVGADHIFMTTHQVLQALGFEQEREPVSENKVTASV